MVLPSDSSWVAYKFYLDDKTDNIGQVNISGDVVPDMFLGASIIDNWTYTVFATQNADIISSPIPEASTLIMLFVGIGVIRTCRKW